MSLSDKIIANITTNKCYFNAPLLRLKNGSYYSGNMWNYPEFFSALLSTLKIKETSNMSIMLDSVKVIKKMNPPLWENQFERHYERGTMLNYYINQNFSIRENNLDRLVKEAIVPSIQKYFYTTNIPKAINTSLVLGPPIPNN